VNQVLHHALKHLMKDIWYDRNEDVRKGQGCPERMDNRLHSGFVASLMKLVPVPICQKVSPGHTPLCAEQKRLVFAQLARGDKALQTAPMEHASH